MASFQEYCDDASVIVQWPVLYANQELVGQGTLLNISHRGGHVAGTMRVDTGMVLKMWISPRHRADALYVKEARVLWARANEFGLELRQVDTNDHHWLMNFFRECGYSFHQA